MVQQQQQQLQYNETGLGGVPSAEVRIRILVGEKGRLGCGVCRGIVPGLTVQVNSILIKRSRLVLVEAVASSFASTGFIALALKLANSKRRSR